MPETQSWKNCKGRARRGSSTSEGPPSLANWFYPVTESTRQPTRTVFCMFSKWLETFLCWNASAASVAKVYLEQICSTWGILSPISSDRGSYFIGKIIQEVERRCISQRLHCPDHPQTSDTRERANNILKTRSANLSEELDLPMAISAAHALMALGSLPLSPHKLSPLKLSWESPCGCLIHFA